MSPKEYNAMFAPFPDHPIHLLPNPDLPIPFFDWLLIISCSSEHANRKCMPTLQEKPQSHRSRIPGSQPPPSDPGVHISSPSSLRLGGSGPFLPITQEFRPATPAHSGGLTLSPPTSGPGPQFHRDPGSVPGPLAQDIPHPAGKRPWLVAGV